MDKMFERLTKVLGSTLVFIVFMIWFGFENIRTYGINFFDWDFLTLISELAIIIGLIILRGQNVQADRQESDIKEGKNTAKRVEDFIKSNELYER